ncbi:MAG: dienelactone hydrolase family protein [Candidatus Marinimicrobia bacterium]|nr:dienelactone hydrolase family protein [Candidatus Neomarinimicrobiota bacterium]
MSRMRHLLLGIMGCALFSLIGCVGQVTPEYKDAILTINKAIELDYLLYLPNSYSSERPWPLVLYLTGLETAGDIDLINQNGPPQAISEGLENDFFVLAPQLPGDVHWDAEALMALLMDIQSEYSIDPGRIYVTGFGDRGGYGCWDVATSYPGTFSKVAPISAPACTEICRVGDVSIRIYHGKIDQLVPLEDAENMRFELDYYCKADVELKVYEGMEHQIWDTVYADSEFWLWLTNSNPVRGGPGKKPLQKHFSTRLSREVEDNYLLYLPKQYEKNASWPLLIFLHGSGSAIEDIEKIRVGGPPKRFEDGMDSEFILLAPQLHANLPWDVERVLALIQKVSNDYNVDATRIYLTGLSRGGFGAWELAVSNPDMFAAVAPIAARDIPGVERLAKTNIWIFHGQDDDGVPWQGSQFMYNRLKHAGANVQLSLLEGVGHNAWDIAYNSEEFWLWLLSQNNENSEAGNAVN